MKENQHQKLSELKTGLDTRYLKLFTFDVFIKPPIKVEECFEDLRSHTGLTPRSDENGIFVTFSVSDLSKATFLRDCGVKQTEIKMVRLTALLINPSDFRDSVHYIESFEISGKCTDPEIRGGMLTQKVTVLAPTFDEVVEVYWKIFNKQIQAEPEMTPLGLLERIKGWLCF